MNWLVIIFTAGFCLHYGAETYGEGLDCLKKKPRRLGFLLMGVAGFLACAGLLLAVALGATETSIVFSAAVIIRLAYDRLQSRNYMAGFDDNFSRLVWPSRQLQLVMGGLLIVRTVMSLQP